MKILLVGVVAYFGAAKLQQVQPQSAAPSAVSIDQQLQLKLTLLRLAEVLPADDTITTSNRLLQVWDRAETLAFADVVQSVEIAGKVDAVWPDVASALKLGDKEISLSTTERIEAARVFTTHAEKL
jgi:hypothetical protein